MSDDPALSAAAGDMQQTGIGINDKVGDCNKRQRKGSVYRILSFFMLGVI
jgi:hypothetical protein